MDSDREGAGECVRRMRHEWQTSGEKEEKREEVLRGRVCEDEKQDEPCLQIKKRCQKRKEVGIEKVRRGFEAGWL